MFAYDSHPNDGRIIFSRIIFGRIIDIRMIGGRVIAIWAIDRCLIVG